MGAPTGGAAVSPEAIKVAGASVASGKMKRAKRKAQAVKKSESAYYIGPLDVLEISVFKVEELSKSVQVADTGTINFPLVGKVKAAGMTAQQLENSLTARLGAKFLENPQVTVFVKEYNSQRVTVSGAVKKPGVFPVRARTTLVSAIAMAEGLHENADTTIVVFRMVNGKRNAARFDLGAIEKGEAKDPVLRGDDKIVVGKSAVKAVFNNFVKAMPIIGKFALFL